MESGQAESEAEIEATPEMIAWHEISIDMSAAGIAAYEKWRGLPNAQQYLSNLVSLVYSAMEALRLHEQAGN